MGNDMMDLQELATYLQRDLREVRKLASRGHLPGHKVAGEWRFARAEINHWIEHQLPGYSEEQLTAVESASHHHEAGEEPLLAGLLSKASVAVPLRASTRAAVLRELVRLAEESWQVYDPAGVLEAIRIREDTASTALPSGVAIPHPRRRCPSLLGEPVMAYGRTASGISFGAPDNSLTDIFFLVCCRDDATHLRVLARLSRLLLKPEFLASLRAANTPEETWQTIADAEAGLLAS